MLRVTLHLLNRLRNRQRQLFGSIPLYMRVMRMLSNEHYKQPVRAFVLDMFDLQLDAATMAAMSNFVREGETSEPGSQLHNNSLSEGASEPAGDCVNTDHNKTAGTTIDPAERTRVSALPRTRVEGFEEPRLVSHERF